MKQKLISKNDIILLTAILVIGVAGILVYSFFAKSGMKVMVYRDGKLIDTLELTKDGEYTFDSELGNNTLEVKDGEASCVDADCPDKLCVKMKNISNTGETIICLPHKLVIEIAE